MLSLVGPELKQSNFYENVIYIVLSRGLASERREIKFLKAFPSVA
jgi:hypothetical protein